MVLDLMMPGMSGLTVLEKVKKLYPKIEVILLTGIGSTSEGLTGMRLGAFDYLMKPLQIDELIQKIGSAINKGSSTK
jgi:DNA-binding response OmpR family regulator